MYSRLPSLPAGAITASLKCYSDLLRELLLLVVMKVKESLRGVDSWRCRGVRCLLEVAG